MRRYKNGRSVTMSVFVCCVGLSVRVSVRKRCGRRLFVLKNYKKLSCMYSVAGSISPLSRSTKSLSLSFGSVASPKSPK